jgi:hypothetical protein
MQEKICPSCSAHALIAAPTCGNCAHVYRTQFVPPLDQTQVFSGPPLISGPLPYIPPPYPAGPVPRPRSNGDTIRYFFFAGVGLFAIILMVSCALVTPLYNAEKARPGHLVRLHDATLIGLYTSEHQVWETLGEPKYKTKNFNNSKWLWPAEGGGAVGVCFGNMGDGVVGVSGVEVADQDGRIIYTLGTPWTNP